MSKAKVFPGSGNGVLGVIVERHGDLERMDASKIAVQMAQHMRNVVEHQKDSAAFAERARVDDKLADELEDLIKKVEARRRGETKSTSRMDRIDTYDPAALRAQADQHRQQAKEFTNKAQEYSAKSVEEDRKAKECQALVARVNNAKKEAASDKKEAIEKVLRDSRRRKV